MNSKQNSEAASTSHEFPSIAKNGAQVTQNKMQPATYIQESHLAKSALLSSPNIETDCTHQAESERKVFSKGDVELVPKPPPLPPPMFKSKDPPMPSTALAPIPPPPPPPGQQTKNVRRHQSKHEQRPLLKDESKMAPQSPSLPPPMSQSKVLPMPPPGPPPGPPPAPPPGPPLAPSSMAPPPLAPPLGPPMVPPPGPPSASLPMSKRGSVKASTSDSSLSANRSKLSEKHDLMTQEYLRDWKLSESNINACVEDVEYVIDTLKAIQPTMFTLPSNHTPYFDMLRRAVLGAESCSIPTRTRIVETVIWKEWAKFTDSFFTLIFHQVSPAPEQWEYKDIEIACGNLRTALEILRHPIRELSSKVALKIFDQHYETIFRRLNDPILLDVIGGVARFKRNKVIITLLRTLQDFALVRDVRDKIRSETSLGDLEILLNKYIAILGSNPAVTLCHRSLSYLTVDEGSMPQLPVDYLLHPNPSDDNVSTVIEDISYVLKRISLVSPQNHIKHPWRYEYDFSFIKLASSPCTKTTETTRKLLHEAATADGSWYKLSTKLYLHLMSEIDKLEPSSDFPDNINCTLVNVYTSFIAITNGSDSCRNTESCQQIFDHFNSFIVNQLGSERIANALKDAQASLLTEIGDCMLTIVHNLTYYFEPCIPEMREKGMMAVVRKLRDDSVDNEVKTSCLLIIAYLLDESDDKEMVSISNKELVYLIQELEKSLLSSSASEYHADELIDGLNRIAVIDSNKLKLIQNGILPLLVKSLNASKYSPSHQTSGATAIWNLAFTEESRNEIIAQKGIMTALHKLKTSDHREVRAAVAGALWQLEGKRQHVIDVEKSPRKLNGMQSKHIMLSYNHQGKAEVFKMKQRLESLGYNIWIDVEQITAGASTLEAMSNAIEGSSLVLIFFSEAYKNSVNCRAEAEYVFERRKPFLPIQVQPKYIPDGWLGILFGSKYRFTLSKPERYDMEVTGLLGKVKEIITGQPEVKDQTDGPSMPMAIDTSSIVESSDSHIKSQELECANWSPKQISSWLEKSGLGEFKDSFRDLTGLLLSELVILYQYHPDSFYTIIGKTPNATPVTLLKFGCEVKRLFNHSKD